MIKEQQTLQKADKAIIIVMPTVAKKNLIKDITNHFEKFSVAP